MYYTDATDRGRGVQKKGGREREEIPSVSRREGKWGKDWKLEDVEKQTHTRRGFLLTISFMRGSSASTTAPGPDGRWGRGDASRPS